MTNFVKQEAVIFAPHTHRKTGPVLDNNAMKVRVDVHRYVSSISVKQEHGMPYLPSACSNRDKNLSTIGLQS
ncbi:hypothetical protein [Pseudoalteromonas xiamenensis]|uniref:hypothetical protein n=1 Tax=Pseudoalteromonas xiamenensis TaxID=882626 RepID=UPI0027E599B3|nr:hypothetical protein [Pseudoalteromonas xiamenensis]WMN59996.1 hypothetical protein NI389_00775 [Pseudoalteromonas xiamenensis]